MKSGKKIILKIIYMWFFTIILLALSLSADAFAVSLTAGVSEKQINSKQAIKMALSFWIFQAIMPIFWFLLASLFSSELLSYNYWIAFILLSYIWINMIKEGFVWWDESNKKWNIFALKSLITLWIATSIDALAVWVSLTATTQNIYIPALFIWIITFIVSYIWVEFWKKFSNTIWSKSEILGWLILIWIWINILINHFMN